MLTVWGRKTSSNVQALMWCVGELGLSYERHDIGDKYGGNDTPSFLAPETHIVSRRGKSILLTGAKRQLRHGMD